LLRCTSRVLAHSLSCGAPVGFWPISAQVLAAPCPQLAKAATGAENRLRIAYNQEFTADCNCRGGLPRGCAVQKDPRAASASILGSVIAAHAAGRREVARVYPRAGQVLGNEDDEAPAGDGVRTSGMVSAARTRSRADQGDAVRAAATSWATQSCSPLRRPPPCRHRRRADAEG
jgi:hypothetical protein